MHRFTIQGRKGAGVAEDNKKADSEKHGIPSDAFTEPVQSYSVPERIHERAEQILAQIDKLLHPHVTLPWVLFMTWRDLLFASWRVPPEIVRAKVPPELDLDTFDGSAWVTLVPMHVTGMHYRDVPPIPGMVTLRELNFRTYVKRNGKGGVYFLSIECPAIVSDWMALHLFKVPYLKAQIVMANDGVTYHYASERTQSDMPPAAFFGTFSPSGETASPAPGSLESFLVERFCLFFVKDGKVYRGDIHHEAWKLQSAELNIGYNTIAKAAGFDLAEKPDHIAFSPATDTLVWLPVHDKRGGVAGG
jgi:uncharacterized protein YqjF (DUF2071 family)